VSSRICQQIGAAAQQLVEPGGTGVTPLAISALPTISPQGGAQGARRPARRLRRALGGTETTMLRRRRFQPTVGDNQAFVTLLAAARNDRQLSRSLLAILSLPSFQRHSLLNSMLQEMMLRSEEADLIAAVTALLDDAVAARAAELLKGDR